jgi:hypothetical protein
MTDSDLLKRGRQAFQQQEWQKAFDLFSAAGRGIPVAVYLWHAAGRPGCRSPRTILYGPGTGSERQMAEIF